MAKTGLILTSVDDDDSIRLNSGSIMQDGVITINKKIYFRVPDGENPRQYSDLDVYAHPNFPRKKSALSQDPRYKFYGNASISHERDESRYFIAELEYTTTDPNATDEDGENINEDTPPWKLRPENVNISYPERQVPFEAAYNSSGKKYDANGQVLIPVQNSAGTPFVAQTTQRDMEISFNFAAKSWNINNGIRYGSTINSQAITVCGVEIPAKRGLLKAPECDFVRTFDDTTGKVKWEYWNVRCSILITFAETGFDKVVLDIGDTAFFTDLQYKDDLLWTQRIFPGNTKVPGQICRFRKYKKEKTGKGNRYNLLPIGDEVFCSYDQFLAFRTEAISISTIIQDKNEPDYDKDYAGGVLDPQCEQLSQMPLKDGFLDLDAIKIKKYRTKHFLEYQTKSWASLNLPKKA